MCEGEVDFPRECGGECIYNRRKIDVDILDSDVIQTITSHSSLGCAQIEQKSISFQRSVDAIARI